MNNEIPDHIIQALRRLVNLQGIPGDEQLVQSWEENMGLGEDLPEDIQRLFIERKAQSDEKFKAALSNAKESNTKILLTAKPFHYLQVANLMKPTMAAAVVGLLFCGYYFFYKKDSVQAPIAVAKYNDVLPGSSKATLTLADGREIILNEASLGEIAQEGSTSINMEDSGQLSYANKTSGTGANGGPAGMNTISIPKGGEFVLTLSDGTKVWMNAATTLRYPAAFGNSDRRVELSGEAYFEVAPNSNQPFHVTVRRTDEKVPAVEVEVLGTNFNINSYSTEKAINTTLISGKVRVSATGKTDPSLGQILKPSEQAQTFAKHTNTIRVNTEDVVAWKDGFFKLTDAPLKSVLDQVARWYDVEIRDQSASKYSTITGSFSRKSNLNEALQILKDIGIQCKVENRTVYIF